MNLTTFSVGNLYKFYYKNSHPDKQRLVLVHKMSRDTITGTELDTGEIKQFHKADAQELELLPFAKLPTEADEYANEIFGKIFDTDSQNIAVYELDDELIGFKKPLPRATKIKVQLTNNYFTLSLGTKNATWFVKNGELLYSGNLDSFLADVKRYLS